jgi:hypothetical protein
MSNITGEFIHGFFHLHSGLLFTIEELFRHPGTMIRGYLSGKRVSYFNPFTYLVLISILGGFLFHYSGWIEHSGENILATRATILFTQKHFSYRMLMTIPSFAIVGWILFRSHGYNLAEHLIINTFLISQTTLILAGWMIISSLAIHNGGEFEILFNCSYTSVMIYQIIVFFRLFNTGNTLVRGLKSIVLVIAGLGLGFVMMNFLTSFLKV